MSNHRKGSSHLRHLAISAGIFSLPLFLPPLSNADIVFSNFGPSFAYNTSGGNDVGNAFDGNNYAEGDTFTPGHTDVFADLRIALSCFVSCPSPFTVDLTANSGDQPGAVIESFSVLGTSLGPLGANNPPVLLTSVLKPTLTAGTQYWVTVSSTLADSITWNWNTTGDTSDQAISTDGGSTWFSPSGLTPSAYQIDGTTAVPEPGLFWLSAAGFAICMLRRRFRAS
ncbi:MAG: hypothetical protein JO336_00430 [Acidobacteriia bacterium]|nr:hypothetical protein [Terriglobia bacterium]